MVASCKIDVADTLGHPEINGDQPHGMAIRSCRAQSASSCRKNAARFGAGAPPYRFLKPPAGKNLSPIQFGHMGAMSLTWNSVLGIQIYLPLTVRNNKKIEAAGSSENAELHAD